MTAPVGSPLPAPPVTGRFVLRDVVVDVVTGGTTTGQDVEVVDGVVARIGATGRATGAEHGTWHCPTLIWSHTQQFPDEPEHGADPRLRFIAPDEVARWRKSARRFAKLPEATRQAQRAHWPTQLRLLRVLADAGVDILAGTDANGAGWVIPGFALHDEFDLMASAGLSPPATTSAPARFFGLGSVAGQVSVGYRADLVLLGADPTADHRALHDIRAVVRAGELWSREDLDVGLSRLEATPTAR